LRQGEEEFHTRNAIGDSLMLFPSITPIPSGLRKVLAIDAQYAERVAYDLDLPYFPVRGLRERMSRDDKVDLPDVAADPAPTLDRQRAFGPGLRQAAADLWIGVISLGGLGMLAVEQLARAGFRTLRADGSRSPRNQQPQSATPRAGRSEPAAA
jgi:hypothetical protein